MRLFTTAHVLLFLYVVAALVFWGVSLSQMSETIYELEYKNLRHTVDSVQHAEQYYGHLDNIQAKLKTRKAQYLGEGSTSLLLIIVGAAVVYSSFRRSVRLSRQQNNFMLAVTHELKSPIAAIKLNLQTMERHNLDEEKKALLTDRCISEANRLNDLCNNLLLASQIEGRQYRPAKEEFSFTDLIYDSVKDYSQSHPGRFSVPDLPDFSLVGDKTLVQMAVNNLVGNAIKYTPANTTIVISLVEKKGHVVVSVADNGPGVPDGEKQKIFTKFYRIGNEETRKSKGTGLGLYLTSKIVKQHKGKIVVRDNEPNGAIFEMYFPQA